MRKQILVTGGTGLVGRALQRIMPDAIYTKSNNFDLRITGHVMEMFQTYKPTHVIHLAAVVSGITENINRPCDHFTDNILMNTNMVEAARRHKCKMFIGMLSTCIYPDIASKYPMEESIMHEGPPTPTNFSYGYAKRAMAVQIDACNKQYGTRYSYLIPCNLYGLDDKYGKDSHFIAALIKKIHHAKVNKLPSIELMGDGKPLRQSMFAGDLAEIIKYFIDNEITESVNIAPFDNYSISEIARIALKACEATHLNITYNTKFPSGQHRKDVDNAKLLKIMPDLNLTDSLYDGIKKTYEHYVNYIYSEYPQ